MARDGLITNRYSRYLDTLILRYIDTFNAKTGSRFVTVAPPSRGKFLHSHTKIDILMIRSNRNAGHNLCDSWPSGLRFG